MTEGGASKKDRKSNTFDIGGLFRGSATVTFVVQILSVIVMLGSLAAYYVGGFIPEMTLELQVLLLLIGSIIALLVFLAALGIFIRFSRRISDLVIGPGIQEVNMDMPRVKLVLYLYGILVALMAVLGLYVWFLVDLYYLAPWAAGFDSVSLRIFGLTLGAFFVALLVQLIVALVGRTATKVVLEVLAQNDQDDEDFLH